VYDEENNIYENGNDDKAVFSKKLKVEGNCIEDKAEAFITVKINQEAIAGEELIVTLNIANQGNTKGTFKINTEGEDLWAYSSINKAILELEPGSSETISITFDIYESALGKESFDIKVLSNDGNLVQQPVSVSIQKQGFFDGEFFNLRFLQNALEGEKLLIGIVLIIIILIILIKIKLIFHFGKWRKFN
jgi:hypothetical protein